MPHPSISCVVIHPVVFVYLQTNQQTNRQGWKQLNSEGRNIDAEVTADI